MRIAIRSAVASDLERLIEISTMAAAAPQWSKSQFASMLDAESDAALRRIVLVAESEAVVVGFIVVAVLADEAEIESVAADVGHRRCGIGRALCQAMIETLKEMAVVHLRLEVRESNTSARALYEALGLRAVGKRREYYSDPVEDALVMELLV